MASQQMTKPPRHSDGGLEEGVARLLTLAGTAVANQSPAIITKEIVPEFAELATSHGSSVLMKEVTSLWEQRADLAAMDRQALLVLMTNSASVLSKSDAKKLLAPYVPDLVQEMKDRYPKTRVFLRVCRWLSPKSIPWEGKEQWSAAVLRVQKSLELSLLRCYTVQQSYFLCDNSGSGGGRTTAAAGASKPLDRLASTMACLRVAMPIVMVTGDSEVGIDGLTQYLLYPYLGGGGGRGVPAAGSRGNCSSSSSSSGNTKQRSSGASARCFKVFLYSDEECEWSMEALLAMSRPFQSVSHLVDPSQPRLTIKGVGLPHPLLRSTIIIASPSTENVCNQTTSQFLALHEGLRDMVDRTYFMFDANSHGSYSGVSHELHAVLSTKESADQASVASGPGGPMQMVWCVGRCDSDTATTTTAAHRPGTTSLHFQLVHNNDECNMECREVHEGGSSRSVTFPTRCELAAFGALTHRLARLFSGRVAHAPYFYQIAFHLPQLGSLTLGGDGITLLYDLTEQLPLQFLDWRVRRTIHHHRQLRLELVLIHLIAVTLAKVYDQRGQEYYGEAAFGSPSSCSGDDGNATTMNSKKSDGGGGGSSSEGHAATTHHCDLKKVFFRDRTRVARLTQDSDSFNALVKQLCMCANCKPFEVPEIEQTIVKHWREIVDHHPKDLVVGRDTGTASTTATSSSSCLSIDQLPKPINVLPGAQEATRGSTGASPVPAQVDLMAEKESKKKSPSKKQKQSEIVIPPLTDGKTLIELVDRLQHLEMSFLPGLYNALAVCEDPMVDRLTKSVKDLAALLESQGKKNNNGETRGEEGAGDGIIMSSPLSPGAVEGEWDTSSGLATDSASSSASVRGTNDTHNRGHRRVLSLDNTASRSSRSSQAGATTTARASGSSARPRAIHPLGVALTELQVSEQFARAAMMTEEDSTWAAQCPLIEEQWRSFITTQQQQQQQCYYSYHIDHNQAQHYTAEWEQEWDILPPPPPAATSEADRLRTHHHRRTVTK